MESPTQNPFENIALALSGGGFRAASFGLGTMSYLHHLQWQGKSMLEHVSFISSTSGGSITNAIYTLRLYMGQPIARILHDLYSTLQGDKLLETAMDVLTDDAVWKKYPHKHRNLINAFAITYDRDLFLQRNLGEFWDADGSQHIEEVCINATELNNGISFRFKIQRGDPNIAAFGNNYLRFKSNALWAVKSLRIGDIVAASSCFPLGFEPIVFPDDFAAGELTPAALMAGMNIRHNNPLDLDRVKKMPFGLIDGGVVDNQGIYSLGLEDSSRKKENTAAAGVKVPEKQSASKINKPFSLLIIADVASYFMKPYESPKANVSWWKKLPLITVLPAMCLAAILPFVAAVIFALEEMPWYNQLMLMPGFVLSGLLGWLYLSAARKLRQNADLAPIKALRRHLFQLLKMPVSWWWDTLTARADSFSQLAQDVFLKQIRRMHQHNAYNDPANENRLMSNFIYDLSFSQRNRREKEQNEKDAVWWPQYASQLTPSPAIETVAELARNVGTTLWFDPKSPKELEDVVATGQFSTCYNLIKYINRLEIAQHGLTEDLKALRLTLLVDWARFQKDPYWQLPALQMPVPK
jgi:predicted acylesterase/phospholipase RssA